MTAPVRKYASNEAREAKKTAKAFGWGMWKWKNTATKEKGYYVGPQLPQTLQKKSIEVAQVSV